MVLQKAVDNLKGQPKEDKTAVASGVAVFVVIILVVMWGFFFLRKIQRGAPLEFGNSAQNEFDFSSVRDAQKEIENNFKYTEDELRAIRDSATAEDTQQGYTEMETGSGRDQFGVSDDAF